MSGLGLVVPCRNLGASPVLQVTDFVVGATAMLFWTLQFPLFCSGSMWVMLLRFACDAFKQGPLSLLAHLGLLPPLLRPPKTHRFLHLHLYL